ncbi:MULTISPECIES: 16S rRNA (cytosine(1402)-N(4))-methyltransferase RsmH [spotted fever group]|uniref:S-adenosyl-methyltransferase mraw, putative n=2 Tax=cellular organisms TaxID=131567 RepID=B7P651_IXOSC|nr:MULTISPECIES: 16S rRNA (cytosine(1402)-N(4))-methyltransferase RsmH [spotted fever group]EEC02073.1 S-adenosyl-methyltransferase mraw, putative [Ixodes scapularis]EER21893.1 S-adenosyl-methyltransferase MraW [Rickettsia endosymbiont of Ixodes scapularis]KDO03730.1 Ribosomal RNA small subunit methyltransferase H [Rickettsia tamurae subsp. buchneri]|eukprot:XP_002408444.1 S-adenosyl-methyltransferase mraw, putative [Ixodes scapularis]
MIQSHVSVMLNEMLEALSPKDGESYLDCTFGAGGYSKAILESYDCYITALDRDPNVIKRAEEIKQNYGERFDFIETNFADSFTKLKKKKFDGIVLDLGVSSMQLDIADRGFSFLHDGPLDMRMSGQGLNAEEFVNTAEEKELADVIYKYGDESFSRRIARRIVEYRKTARIDSTDKLAEIVRNSIGFRKGKIDPATKTFQAIRIYINDELGELERFLANVKNILKKDGRLVVVSFHSLEDRIVKNFFKENSEKPVARSKYAKDDMAIDPDKWLKIITNKALAPSDKEVGLNIRARSAKLRAAKAIYE